MIRMISITDPKEKAEYLDKHLTYRINSMLAYDLIIHRKTTPEYAAVKDSCYGDSPILEPIFEISIIFGRTLLNFLGLSFDKTNNKIVAFNPKADDLTIKSLFPDRKFCAINHQIVLENHDALCTLIKLANKSVAHLTASVIEITANDQEKLPKARKAIYKLMLEHVPEMNKEKIWWTTQIVD